VLWFSAGGWWLVVQGSSSSSSGGGGCGWLENSGGENFGFTFPIASALLFGAFARDNAFLVFALEFLLAH